MRTKLHIFKAAAHHLSFTKAAEKLFISQPAVSKVIGELESLYKTNFFIRKRNSIELTPQGILFLQYTDKILAIYSEMEDRFLNPEKETPAQLNFGASTTVANYVVPKILAAYKLKYPITHFTIKSGNSEEIEELILNQQLDFGITEGKNTNRKLQFKNFIKDEIVLVTRFGNNSIKQGPVSKKEFIQCPIIEREAGSGTRKIIYKTLKSQGIDKLNVTVHLNSTEAIKNYLYHTNSFALVSRHAIREDILYHKLKIIPIKDLVFERWFYFVCRTGFQSKTMDQFQRFFLHNHNL